MTRTSPETETLKPCPFCGCEPYVALIEPHSHKGGIAAFMPDHQGSATVECGCGAGLIDDDEETVRRRWNQRAGHAQRPTDTIAVDAKLLHSLWCYGSLNTVEGVVYSYGSHQKCLDAVDDLIADHAALSDTSTDRGGK